MESSMMAQPWTASRPTGVPQYYGMAATRMYENARSVSPQAAMPASSIKNYANSNMNANPNFNVNTNTNTNGRVNTIQTRQASSNVQSTIASSPDVANPNNSLHQRRQNYQHSLSNQWAHRAYSHSNPNPIWDNSGPAVSTLPKENSRDFPGVEVEDNDDDPFEASEQAVRRL